MKRFWVCFVEDKFDLDSVFQTKTEFSYSIMDRIGGGEENVNKGIEWVQD